MAFEKIFKGSPTDNNVVTSASPQNPQLGVNVDDDSLWVNSGTGWTEVGSGGGGGITQLTGDVTAGPGSGSQASTIANSAITTAKINNSAVTLAKIANASANSKLLGSGASGSGAAYTELTLGTNLSITGTTLNASGGGGGGDVTQIAQVVVGAGGAATVTFSSIPGTFSSLRLVGQAQSNQSDSDGINMQFNGDSGNNYNWAVLFGGASGGGHTNQTSVSAAQIGFLQNNSTSDASQLDASITNYAGTTFFKSAIGLSMRGGPGWDEATYATSWSNTAAITQITLSPAVATKFNEGSVFTLYGFK